MRKGQAAMEFLMTYGWAILVVIAAIAALAYFGVLDPARLLPERCQSTAGMDCVDKASILDASEVITVALRNNVGFDVTITGVTASACGVVTEADAVATTVGACTPVDPFVDETVNNNEVFRACITCTSGLTAGDKYDGVITVTYTNTETGLAHSVPVEVRGKVA